MDYALVYLLWRALYRIKEFFRHWYVVSFWRFGHWAVSFLERLDRTLALRITLKYFFQPLFKDYTVVGYIMGFVFRSIRVVIGVIVYACVLPVLAAAYVMWLLIPVFIVAKALGA